MIPPSTRPSLRKEHISVDFKTMTPKPSNTMKESDCAAYLSACQSGKIAAVRKWVQSLPQWVNLCDAQGTTALMFCALSANIKTFDSLLKQCSLEEIQKVDWCGRNALFYACEADEPAIVNSLLQREIPIVSDTKDKYALDFSREKTKVLALLNDKTARQKQLDEYRVTARAQILQLQITGGVKRDLTEEESNTLLKQMQKEFGAGRVCLTPVTKTNEQTHKPCQVVQFPLNQPTLECTPRDSKEWGLEMGHDLVNRKEIAKHFREHPPEGIPEAIKWVFDHYAYKPSANQMKNFLEYLGYTFAET